jgi:hypothetical protein
VFEALSLASLAWFFFLGSSSTRLPEPFRIDSTYGHSSYIDSLGMKEKDKL